MSVTLICTACGTRIDSTWIRNSQPGRPFDCPHCGRPLSETGYVEVSEEEERGTERNGDERAA